MAKLKIMSCNGQGLGNFRKRRDLFQYLRQKNCSVYFLQDTHFEKKIERQIRAEWGYECYFSNFSSQSRGVAILLNNNFDFKIRKIIRDKNGNFLIVNLDMLDEKITLINVYGPNRDTPDFYLSIKNKIIENNLTNIIWGGDWNLVLNPNLDLMNYRNNNNQRAQETVLNIKDYFELSDVWREINPEVPRFTWRRPTPFQQSRLDFFLISEPLLSYVRDADIVPGYRSDHSFITVEFEFKQEMKHKTYWKFNSSLLKDFKCNDEIKATIIKVTQQYALPVYNFDNIDKTEKKDLQFTISDQLFLDVLLMEIRSTVLSYSAKKKRENINTENALEQEIQQIESKLHKTLEDHDSISAKKQTLQNLRKEKMDGILLRSRAKWASQGEKVSKYFCNLEKRHYISKQMFKLTNDDGTTVSKTEEMVEKTRIFYEQLYKKREVADIPLDEYVQLPKLDETEANAIEGLITYEEASTALRNMNNGKSPGTDGFTVEFFKFFWGDIGHFVVRSINEGFSNKKMSTTQREGVIVCIPKGDKPREYLKNWRPISLLNVVYKIGSSSIANRIKKVLPKLINEDQSGFVQGRYIGDNIRLLYDIIHYLKEKKMPGLLVSIDFEKAFDSIDWSFMKKVLKSFGFGDDLIQWISAFYKDIKSTVIVNGQISQHIQIERGCRQGDPISPYLFILCAEVLACKIREDREINGIQIDDTVFKISQFADDTAFLLNDDQRSFENLFGHLDSFASISGLKLNHGKTLNVWLGSKCNSQTKWLPHLNMTWNPPKFKILGIWFTNTLENMDTLNYDDKFHEVQKLFAIWLQRTNTPMGRTVVLKSLVLSKLIYLWILLPNPPNNILRKLQSDIFNFVWDNKNDKIKRSISVRQIKDGGINIPHIETYIQSLKLTWMQKLLSDKPPKWKCIMSNQHPELELINVRGPKAFLNNITNPFWADFFKAYNNLSNMTIPSSPEDILAEPLFDNDKFKIGGVPFRFNDWIEKGIFTVSSLINENGSFKTLQEFSLTYGLNPRFLDYLGCINTVKKYCSKYDIRLSTNNLTTLPKALDILLNSPKGSRYIYTMLLGKKDMSTAAKNWEKIMGKQLNWEAIFRKVSRIKEVKIKWFQMKICYRVLVTNSILKNMGIIETNLCNFCGQERDTIIHYLWECQRIQTFWKDFKKCFLEKCMNSARMTITKCLIIFGKDERISTDEGFDHILLQTKFYIHKCRINKILPNIVTWKEAIREFFVIDKHVNKIEMSMYKFNSKWFPYLGLIE